MGDRITFLKNFLQNPRQIGSVIPSSNSLSKKMVEQIDFNGAESIIELGPGTGPYTKLILERKRDITKYVAFEKNEDMRRILNSKFQNINLYEDAVRLRETIDGIGIHNVDYIVSGLPFTVLDKEDRNTILKQSYDSLKDGGKFITYQYSLDLYNHLKTQYSNVKVKVVPFNIPIAFVYVCTK